MFDEISILFVLVVRTVRFDNSIDTIDCAGDTVARDKLGEVAET